MEALYKLRARPGAEGFAAAWDAALERGMQRLEDCALERALKGTPTPIVSGGKLLGTWDKPDNALLRFLLQHRLPQRYSAQLAPGHPIYETIEAQVLEEKRREAAAGEAEVFARLDAKLALIRTRMAGSGARKAGAGGDAGEDGDGDGCEDEDGDWDEGAHEGDAPSPG